MEIKTLLPLFALLALLAGGCKGEGATPSSGKPEGPGDLSKLTPEEQIEKVRNDPQMPANLKETAINSIKQKNGIK